MKKFILLILVFFSIVKLFGQEIKSLTEGKISYITLQNIYVKFEVSKIVNEGDTIFIRNGENLVPLFVAESVSSTSCVGKPLQHFELKISDVVFVKLTKKQNQTEIRSDKNTITQKILSKADSIRLSKAKAPGSPQTETGMEQKIRGRLSASSYSSFSNSSDFNQRMRYTFSLSADHISGSKFSTDSYVMFSHKLDHWTDVKDNVFNALKIYSLSVKYDLNKNTHILLGRNINPHMASVGAIDGLQAETSIYHFTFGAVIGTNPDYTDYSFNAKLFEYGAYLSNEIKNKTGSLVNSFAFLQQTNAGKIDRRFAYFQHENSLIKNINLFASCEFDLYALQNGIPVNNISLTSLYLSIRYRFSGKLSAYASYDARKNVIYYETFKNYLDQMLEDATRQGYQFRINYRPVNSIYAGVSGGYRFQKNDIHPMLNVNGFLTFSQVPWISSSVSLTTNWLQSSYVNGMIYGIRVDHDIIPSKLSSSVSYRLLDYNYLNTSTKSLQHMGEFELSWQISRKFSFSANYNGTFEKSNQYNNIYINLIKRF